MARTSETSAKAAARQVLFIQGGGEGTHDEWDDKLVASLEGALGSGYDVRYPRMPNEDDPSFGAWSALLEREIARLDDGAILIGHSIGGTILVHALAEQPELLRRIAAICLIAAPFVGDGGWPSDDIVRGPDWAAPLAGVAVHLYQGNADEITPMTHLDLYAKAIPQAHVRRLGGRDHQLNNDLSEVAEDIRRVSEPAAKPVLLSGGNPQIAKGTGDAPVQAYIAAMPGWKSDVGRRLDAIIERTVPGVRKAVKWNSPFYGVEDEGQSWFLSYHCFTKYVKVTFLRGASLRPLPPGASKHKDVRYLDIHEDELDEAQFAAWVKQASQLPGERL